MFLADLFIGVVMWFKIQLIKEIFISSLFVLFGLLTIHLNILAQPKTNDEVIYNSLPQTVILSEQDINDTIKCFRTDDPKKAAKNFKEKMPPIVTDSKSRQNVYENLPEAVKKLKIENKKVIELVRKIISPVLSFYNRQAAYDILVIKHSTPFIFSDSGVFLVISSGLIERAASDDEIIGYTAHEVAHEFYSQTSIYTKHVLGIVMTDANDQALARKYWESLALIELKCDSFATLTLTQIGYNPISSIEGLERIARDFPKFIIGFHPSPNIRRKIVESIIPTEYFSVKPKFSEELEELKAILAKS